MRTPAFGITIRSLDAIDLRFPTSRTHDGTDAVHRDPDYSAAYVDPQDRRRSRRARLHVHDRPRQRVCAAAIRAFGRSSSGGRSTDIIADPAAFWRSLASDSQLRWLGPEKGVIHLALAAIVNAVWDLYAKVERKPVWKLLADMTPRELVRCIDFRYITDALTPDEAIELLERQASQKARTRGGAASRTGYPAYTTSAGWMGYSDDDGAAPVPRSARRGLDALQGQGRQALRRTMPRRLALVREAIGPDRTADDRRQPAMGRRRSDRARAGAGALQPVVDRGADQPGRCAGPRGDRAGRAADRRRDRRALRQPRDLQAAAAGRGDRASARSTAAASAA